MLAAVVLVYLALTLGIALASSRRATDAMGYYVAHRRLSGWTVGATLGATTVSGSAVLLASGIVFRHGLAGLWFDLAGVAGLVGVGLALASRIRDAGVVTLSELAGRLYGPWARTTAALLVVVAEVAWFGLLARSTMLLLSAGAGVADEHAGILVSGVVILCAAAGGQYSVAFSDVFQIGVVVMGLLVVAVPAVWVRADGLAGLPSGFLDFPVTEGVGWPRIGEWALIVGLPHLVGSDVYGKLLSARNGGAARRGAFVAAGIKLVVAATVVLLGLEARALWPDWSPDEPARVLPRLIAETLSAVPAGVVLAALLAILMSSADSVLLTGATTLVHDLAFRSREPSKRLLRLATLVLGLLGLAVGLGARTLLDLFVLGYTVFASGLSLPILLGLCLGPRVPRSCGAWSMAFGGGTALLSTLWRPFDIQPVVAGVTASLVPVIVLLFAVPVRRLLGRAGGKPPGGSEALE